MFGENPTIDRDKQAVMPAVAGSSQRPGSMPRLSVSAARGPICWLAAKFFRVAALAAVLFGLFGTRASVSELVTGEVVETIEVVVSFHGRHQESETFSASDREFTRRRCVRHRGRNTNVVRCCCRYLSGEIRYVGQLVGHRLPDNSLAPLLI
jgi:hypothetical protein